MSETRKQADILSLLHASREPDVPGEDVRAAKRIYKRPGFDAGTCGPPDREAIASKTNAYICRCGECEFPTPGDLTGSVTSKAEATGAAKAIGDALGVPVRPIWQPADAHEWGPGQGEANQGKWECIRCGEISQSVVPDGYGCKPRSNVHPIMQAAIEPFTRQPHTSSAGPATSQDAGDEHTDSGKRRSNAMRVLWMVYKWPGRTATVLHQCRDARAPLTMPEAMRLQEIRRRLTDLQALDYVEKGERRGREFTWRITTAGLLALSRVEGPLAR